MTEIIIVWTEITKIVQFEEDLQIEILKVKNSSEEELPGKLKSFLISRLMVC